MGLQKERRPGTQKEIDQSVYTDIPVSVRCDKPFSCPLLFLPLPTASGRRGIKEGGAWVDLTACAIQTVDDANIPAVVDDDAILPRFALTAEDQKT
jgi:hypothetical protein